MAVMKLFTFLMNAVRLNNGLYGFQLRHNIGFIIVRYEEVLPSHNMLQFPLVLNSVCLNYTNVVSSLYLPYKVKTQYVHISNIMDAFIKHPISDQSTPGLEIRISQPGTILT